MSSPRKSLSPYKLFVKSLCAASAVALGALLVAMALSTVVAAQMVMDVDHEMESKSAKPQEYKIVTCPNDSDTSLPAGDYNSDLHVVGPCVADGKNGGGMYKYHWVFIHSGGTLTFQDKQLDLYANSILVLNGGTLEAGGPNDTDAIGADGGLVAIHLWGAKDDAAIFCQDQNGKEDAMCDIPSDIWNDNKMDMIYPDQTLRPEHRVSGGRLFLPV